MNIKNKYAKFKMPFFYPEEQICVYTFSFCLYCHSSCTFYYKVIKYPDTDNSDTDF